MTPRHPVPPVLADALAQHREALAACRRCNHSDPAIVPVVSTAREPLAMLVGQAPGRTESVDRRPFSGPAGRTLFRWLARVGWPEALVRERVYIAAVTRCYPGPHRGGRGDRVPSAREQRLCAAWLDAELAILRPRVLIPVGRLAIARFLGDVALADVVGRAHAVRHAGGTSRVVPLPHPSGASSWVHAPGHRVLVERSLALIAEALAGLQPLTPSVACCA